MINAQDKATVIYVGDPMCSWCYGFSPEFSTAMESLSDKVDVQLVMGGLRTYNTETMVELKSFLSHHWEEVAERSGQKFSYGILDETAMPYDTEPCCRAVVTMRKLKPEIEWDFFKSIQIAFYSDNKNPNISATYGDLAEKYGVDRKEFITLFESEEMKKEVQADFKFASNLNARSFPTVILKKGEQYFLVGKGYMTSEDLQAVISKTLDDN